MSDTLRSTSGHVFEVLHSEDIYEGAIMAVRRDTVKMPGGPPAHREVVEHFGAVAVAVIDTENRILLEHQYRHPVAARLWELPAGILDIADESPLHAAQRELQEETGTVARQWSVIVDTVTSPGFADETVRIFLARDVYSVDCLITADEEADMTVQWVPLDTAVDMVFAGEIVNSIAVAGVLGAAHLLSTSVREPRPAEAPWTVRGTRFRQRKSTPKE